MPVNADPEYFAAKGRYENAKTTAEKIAALEELLSKAPTHKGAEKMRGQLKKKLSDLRKELGKKKAGGTGPSPFAVKKEGDAQVVLLGYPNSGKSALLRALTHAQPEVADYPYTTTKPEVGTLKFTGVDIQIVEVPAIIRGSYASDRAGPLFSLIRQADAIILVADGQQPEQLEQLERELRDAGIKKPVVVVMNKSDLGRGNVSALTGQGLDNLRHMIWDSVNKIKVYTRKGSTVADRPMVLPAGSTVEDFTKSIHKGLIETFKYARLFRGNQVKQVGLKFPLEDNDIVEVYA